MFSVLGRVIVDNTYEFQHFLNFLKQKRKKQTQDKVSKNTFSSCVSAACGGVGVRGCVGVCVCVCDCGCVRVCGCRCRCGVLARGRVCVGVRLLFFF